MVEVVSETPQAPRPRRTTSRPTATPDRPPHPWGESKLRPLPWGTDRHKCAVVKREAAEDVIDWVEKVRSWIPAWRRAVDAVKDEAATLVAHKRGKPEPTGLERALGAASRFWSEIEAQSTAAAIWSPTKALTELNKRDSDSAMVAEHRQLPGDPHGRAHSGEHDHGAVYDDLSATDLVGEHIQHLTVNLQEATTRWPRPRGTQGNVQKSQKRIGHETEGPDGDAEPAYYKTVAAEAQLTLDALERALQHALFLTFVHDAGQALPGESRNIHDYCDGWYLTKDQVDDIWRWLIHDPTQLGGRPNQLALDRQNHRVYRKPCTWWQKSYTISATLWGGAIAFGLVAGVFALLDRAGLTSWPTDWPVKLIILFLSVAAGAALHVASRSLSNIRFDDPLKVYAAGEGWDWLRLRWIAILRIYIPIAVVVGLLWGAGTIPGSFQDLGTAVLAGFTADSIFRTSLSAMQAQATAASQS